MSANGIAAIAFGGGEWSALHCSGRDGQSVIGGTVTRVTA